MSRERQWHHDETCRVFIGENCNCKLGEIKRLEAQAEANNLELMQVCEKAGDDLRVLEQERLADRLTIEHAAQELAAKVVAAVNNESELAAKDAEISRLQLALSQAEERVADMELARYSDNLRGEINEL